MALKLKKKLGGGPVEQLSDEENAATVRNKKLRTLIDTRGKLMEEEAKLKARQAEISKQKSETEEAVRKHVSKMELDGTETTVVEGFEYKADVGKIGTSRGVSEDGKVKLFEILGEDTFLELASFKVGDMDKYLTLKQRGEVMFETPTQRSVTVKPSGKK